MRGCGGQEPVSAQARLPAHSRQGGLRCSLHFKQHQVFSSYAVLPLPLLYLCPPPPSSAPPQIFKELADFDVSDAFGLPKDDGHFWWPGLSSRRRRRSSVFPWHWDITKDARFAFTVSPRWLAAPRQRQREQRKETKTCS